MDQVVTRWEPGQALAWRHEAERLNGKPAPRFAASTDFTIELRPAEEGTSVSLHSAQMPAGPLRGLVMRAFGTRDVARSLERSLDSLHQACGRTVIPIQLPIGEERQFAGVVDLVTAWIAAGVEVPGNSMRCCKSTGSGIRVATPARLPVVSKVATAFLTVTPDEPRVYCPSGRPAAAMESVTRAMLAEPTSSKTVTIVCGAT